MHSIPVRRMRFDLPDAAEFHPVYVAGDAAASYHFSGLGLYVALLEPFIVKSARRVLPQIGDPVLAEEVDRFCRQEAQHYQQHERFNALIFGHGYPGLEARYEQLRADFERMLAERDDRYRVGFVEGFEANTTQGALFLLASGVLEHPRTHPAFGELWTWHMLEEIEHRNVAFDLYQHLYGDWLFRARMCWIAQAHMAKFIADCARIMSAADVARHGAQCRVSAGSNVRGLVTRLVPRFRSMAPGYTPHRYTLPERVAALSARFTVQAESAA
jgi:predicted metal-dependent hydrolase